MGSVTLSFVELVGLLILAAFLTAVPASVMIDVGLAYISQVLGIDVERQTRVCRIEAADQDPADDGDGDGDPGDGADGGE